MSSDPGSDGLEQVMRHERGLRRLAAALIANPADADDAVQHAMTQAAMGRRRQGTPLWPFLVTALRRHASNLRKFAARRRAHEQQMPAAREMPSPEEFLAREQLRRHVADAVHALEEPFRTTIWLRWFEGLDNAAVAARTGVPVATVRSRLQRAHAQLAARLDGDYGDRRAWLALATPFSASSVTASVTAVASGLVMKKAIVAAALCVPFALVYVWSPTPVELPAVRAVAEMPPELAGASSPPAAMERHEAEPALVAPAPARTRLAVQFGDGSPARGVAVWLWADDATRPVWTCRVDATRDREVGSGAASAIGVPEPPVSALESDDDGCVPLPAEQDRSAIVSVQYASGQVFSAPRPSDGRPFVLPVLGEVEASMRNLPSGRGWSVLVTPALKESDGSNSSYAALRQNVDAAGGPGVVWRRERRHELTSGDRLHATLPMGLLSAIEVEGHGFVVRVIGHEPRPVVAQPPTLIEAECVRQLPALTVEVLESDERPSTIAGFCNLRNTAAERSPTADQSWSEHRRELASGSATFDEVELTAGTLYSVAVLLADGEWFVREFAFQPTNGVQRVALRRGEGRQPIRLSLPGLGASELGVGVECDDGSIRTAQNWATFYSSSLPVFSRDGARVSIGLVPDNWRRIWVVLEDGRVGSGRRGPAATIEDLSWLPAAESRSIDLAQMYRDHGDHEMMAAMLEIELTNDRGKSTWWRVASHRRFHRTELTPPTWRDLHLPLGLRSRLLLHSGDDPAVGFGPPLEIPLSR
ncbi:MAG: sigma-70 family RNA polymerase sigma factor [Planctomycetota bacterium]